MILMESDSLLFNEDQSEFNAGIEHLKTITWIERRAHNSFYFNDFVSMDRLLDSLWTEIREWLSKEEFNKSINYRKSQKEALKQVLEKQTEARKKASKIFIYPQNLTDPFLERFMYLKELVHKHGLRMKKKANPRFAMADR